MFSQHFSGNLIQESPSVAYLLRFSQILCITLKISSCWQRITTPILSPRASSSLARTPLSFSHLPASVTIIILKYPCTMVWEISRMFTLLSFALIQRTCLDHNLICSDYLCRLNILISCHLFYNRSYFRINGLNIHIFIKCNSCRSTA